jgi:hypothetical protein
MSLPLCSGISWNRKLGETADLAEDEGEETNTISNYNHEAFP